MWWGGLHSHTAGQVWGCFIGPSIARDRSCRLAHTLAVRAKRGCASLPSYG